MNSAIITEARESTETPRTRENTLLTLLRVHSKSFHDQVRLLQEVLADLEDDVTKELTE